MRNTYKQTKILYVKKIIKTYMKEFSSQIVHDERQVNDVDVYWKKFFTPLKDKFGKKTKYINMLPTYILHLRECS